MGGRRVGLEAHPGLTSGDTSGIRMTGGMPMRRLVGHSPKTKNFKL
jgi:hypothetical protein